MTLLPEYAINARIARECCEYRVNGGKREKYGK
jgi:hypothetical protein